MRRRAYCNCVEERSRMSSQPPYGTDPQGQPTQYPSGGYVQPAGYAVPGTPAVPAQTGGNGMSITSLVLGIVGVIIGFIPACGAFVAVPLGILSVIFGALGRRNATGKGMGTAGLILGIVAIVVSVAWWVLIGIAGHSTVTTTP